MLSPAMRQAERGPNDTPELIGDNDNDRQPAAAPAIRSREYPPEAIAVIERHGRSVNQIGRAREKEWTLRFEAQSRLTVDPLTGWTGSSDPLRNVTLRFSTLEDAVRFAERQGLPFRVNGTALRASATLRRNEKLLGHAA